MKLFGIISINVTYSVFSVVINILIPTFFWYKYGYLYTVSLFIVHELARLSVSK